MRLIFLIPTVCLFACDGESADKDVSQDETGETSDSNDTGSGIDADGDGYDAEVDCNDANSDIYPGADELCDGTDNDCDTEFDEDAVDRLTSFTDADGDGYGVDGSETMVCPGAAGYAPVGGDCNDSTSTVSPDASEYCNGIDDDCDGETDEFSVDGTWYADVDRDGFGSNTEIVYDCEQPPGYLPSSGDCDDATNLVNPAATETCDLADNDCNSIIDDNPTDGTPWYIDADLDGSGDAATADNFCSDPGNRVANGDDCDDTNISIYPGAPEVCEDGIDNGCDGVDDCQPSGYLIPGDATVKLLGEAEKDFAGSAVHVGDLNGDGQDDLMIGAYGYNPGGANAAGRIAAHYGPLDGSETIWAADLDISGTLAEDSFGWAVGAGDVDGDGLSDTLVGAYGNDTGGSGAGAAYVFLGGASGSLSTDDAEAVVFGDDTSHQAGWSVAGWDGGFALGVPGHNGGNGAVAILDGLYDGDSLGDAATFVTGDGSAGYAIAVGDVDADGSLDLAVGSPGAGVVGLFLDVTALSGSVTFSAADTTVEGETSGDNLGVSVALGDLDNDGAADLFAGADEFDALETDAGAVYVFLGVGSGVVLAGSADIVREGEVASDFTGRSVAMVGDVNADGLNEFVVGATAFDGGGGAGVGAAYMFYGPATGRLSVSVADAVFQGANAYDAMGHRAAGGDLDGDGFADVVSSAMGRDDNATNSGGVFGWFGSTQ